MRKQADDRPVSGRAFKLGGESSFARQNEALNQIKDLLKRCDDRMPFYGVNPAKRYVEGHLDVVVDIRVGAFPEKYHAFVSGIPSGRNHAEMLGAPNKGPDVVEHVGGVSHRHEALVFIHSFELAERPKELAFGSASVCGMPRSQGC